VNKNISFFIGRENCSISFSSDERRAFSNHRLLAINDKGLTFQWRCYGQNLSPDPAGCFCA
jgi:hypothetical protein